MSLPAPGAALPPIEETFSVADLAMYGGATWDWHRLHYDAQFAQSLKLPGPVIDGQMYGALFARQAMAALGPRAFVRKLGFRMRNMAFAGDTLRLEGEVKEVRRQADGTLVVLAQRIAKDGRTVAEATTEVHIRP